MRMRDLPVCSGPRKVSHRMRNGTASKAVSLNHSKHSTRTKSGTANTYKISGAKSAQMLLCIAFGEARTHPLAAQCQYLQVSTRPPQCVSSSWKQRLPNGLLSNENLVQHVPSSNVHHPYLDPTLCTFVHGSHCSPQGTCMHPLCEQPNRNHPKQQYPNHTGA